MANSTIYPYGTGGSLPSSIGIVDDLITGGADKALSAQQGKILNEQLNDYSLSDLSSLSSVQAAINSSTGQWATNSSQYSCKFLRVNAGTTYIIRANEVYNSRIAVLTSNSHTHGTAASFASGQSVIAIEKNTDLQLTIPDDGRYLYILTLNNGNDCTPASVALVENRLSGVENDISVINSQRINTEALSTLTGWIINPSNKWDNSGRPTSDYVSILIPVTPGEDYLIVTGKTSCIYAILQSNSRANNTSPDFCQDYPTRRGVQSGDVFSFTAPADAAYVYLVKKSSGVEYDSYLAIPKSIDEQFKEAGTGERSSSDFDPDSVINVASAFGNKLYPLEPNLDGNGYVIPETLQELNVQKKAEQFAGLKWTPLAAIPYNTYNSTNKSFPAGTQVTGLPYSSVKELDKYVGKDVSIHTFMTAVNNPYSLIYTENVSEDNSTSAWGKTYHGNNAACYYGQVCSQFTAMCSGGTYDYATEEYAGLSRHSLAVVRLYDQSAQSVRIGDAFWREGHCRLIYAVKKNSEGAVTNIKIAESTYNHTIINSAVTANAFDNEIKNDGCIIYRPLWLHQNIKYEPSPYVPIRDEEQQEVTYNDDICTFAGDRACFRQGETIVLNYNLKSVGAWTGIELYKGTTLLDTITIDPEEHIVNLTSRNLTYGKYKARMTDGTNYSDYTYFEIIDTTVTATANFGILTMSFSSANATPLYFKVCLIGGNVRAMREFSIEELAKGQVVCDYAALSRRQHPDRSISGVALYLKVYFQGEYGRVTNEPILIAQ